MAAGGGRPADLPSGELAVVDDRVGDHPDLIAGRVRPPAEVDVVAEQRRWVEAAELVPHVAADQHAGRADGEHGPAAVVLALVDLARLDPGEPPAGPVRGDARLAYHAPVGQVLQLRAHDGRSRCGRPRRAAARGRRGRARSRHAAARSTRWRLLGRPLPPPNGPLGTPAHWRWRCHTRSRDPCRRPRPGRAARSASPRSVPAAGVHPDHPLHRMGLLAHRVDEPRQQPGAVVSDDHSRDDVTGAPGALWHCVLWR